MENKLQVYKVELEVTAPVTLTYKVTAESPEQAELKIKYLNPHSVSKPKLGQMRKIKSTVYHWFYTNVLKTKRY